jgi:prolyl oligopeptidase
MRIIFTLILALIFSNCLAQHSKTPDSLLFQPSNAADTLYGRIVPDPYRVLESMDKEHVEKWFEDQGTYTISKFKGSALLDQIQKELEANVASMGDVKLFGMPVVINDKIYYTRRLETAEDNQVVTRSIATGEEKVIYTTNEDIVQITPSPNHQHVAMLLSTPAEEVSTLYVLETATGKILQEKISRQLIMPATWLADGSGFFYHQFKKTDDPRERFTDGKIKFHAIGTSIVNDLLVVSQQKDTFLTNFEYCLIKYFPGSEKVFLERTNLITAEMDYYQADLDGMLSGEEHWSPLFSPDTQVNGIAVNGSQVYTTSRKDQHTLTEYKLQQEGYAKPVTSYSMESRFNIDGILMSSNGILVKASLNEISVPAFFDFKNKQFNLLDRSFTSSVLINDYMRPIAYNYSETYVYDVESWTTQNKVFLFDSKTGEKKLLPIRANIKTTIKLVSERVEVKSHDGVMVPLTIIHREGLKIDGNHPLILTGYGNFGITAEPVYKDQFLPFFQRGGIKAIAHVRGGGDKGQEWHDAGKLFNKSNSWKDLTACAEYLLRKSYASRKTLGLFGGSAGGITVANAVLSSPELYSAVLLGVSVLNPFRFSLSGNPALISEIGSMQDSAQCMNLIDVDPYLNVKKGVDYPPFFVTTDMEDNRTAPWQPAKMVARLQEYDPTGNHLLFVTNQGHLSVSEESMAYFLTFYLNNLTSTQGLR